MEKHIPMTHLHEAIGLFLAKEGSDKKVFGEEIDKLMADLIDDLILSVQQHHINIVADGLIERMFSLRVKILEWMREHEHTRDLFQQGLQEYLNDKIKHSTYSVLIHAVSDAIMHIQKISASYINSQEFWRDIGNSGVDHLDISYSQAEALAESSLPERQYVKKYVDASLKLEMSLIVAELVLTNKIKMSRQRIEQELIDYIYTYLNRYGAYAIFTGFWKPDPEDESTLTNRMKILSASIEMDHGYSYKTTTEEFSKMLRS